MVYDLQTAERIRHLMADRADVYERKMMGGLVFMVKGGMCCVVSGRGGLLVRVEPEDQPRLVAQAHVKPMIMGGRKVKAYVRVMPESYRRHANLKKWVERGITAIANRPTKPRHHRKKAATRT
jgi:TfoX/Sxy family transcriptional regulator of competence genes